MAYQGQQGDGRCVDVRRERHAKCDSIARIPPTAGAHAVEEHACAEGDSLSETDGIVIATLPGLSKGNEGECSRDYPARCTTHPAPAKPGWIELHLVVERPEFPAPQPVCLAASRVQEPLDSGCQALRCLPGVH